MASQQIWATNSLGGFFANPWLSQKIRHAAQPLMRFRQFTDVKQAFGRKRGDRFLYDKISNISAAGGTLAETATIPERRYTVQQGSVVINEYGNSIPFSGKLDTLSEFDVTDITQRVLRDDQAKVLDSAAGTQFMSADYVAVCTTTASVVFTSNGVATATASADITGSNVRSIVDFMKKRNIPKFDGEHYICVASTQSLNGLYQSLESVEQYTEASVEDFADGTFYKPMRGERGRYYGVRFIEETNFLSNVIGSGTAFGQAVFFGADAVAEAVAIPEEIRAKVPTDYGRDMGLAWYALLGFQKFWSFSGDAEEHIVAVKSA